MACLSLRGHTNVLSSGLVAPVNFLSSFKGDWEFLRQFVNIFHEEISIILVLESNMAAQVLVYQSTFFIRFWLEEESDWQKKGNEYLPKTAAVFEKTRNKNI